MEKACSLFLHSQPKEYIDRMEVEILLSYLLYLSMSLSFMPHNLSGGPAGIGLAGAGRGGAGGHGPHSGQPATENTLVDMTVPGEEQTGGHGCPGRKVSHYF